MLKPRHPPLKVVIKMIDISTQYNGVKKRVKRPKAKATDKSCNPTVRLSSSGLLPY